MDSSIASLEAAIETTQEPLEKAAALNSLAWALRSRDAERCLRLTVEAEQLAETAGKRRNEPVFRRVLARSLFIRGIAEIELLHYAEARLHLTQAHELYNKDNDEKALVEVLHRLGVVCLLTGDNTGALAYTSACLELRRKSSTAYELGLTLSNMGMISARLGNSTQALAYYRESLELCRESGDTEGIGDVLMKTGNVLLGLGDYTGALEYMMQSLPVVETTGNRRAVGNVLMNIGSIYYAQGHYREALEWYGRSIVLFEEVGARRNLGLVTTNVGSVYMRFGDYAQALECFLKSLAVSEELGDRYGRGILLMNIGQVYRETGDTERALEYFLRSFAVREESGDKSGQAEALMSSVGLLATKGEMERALAFGERALALFCEMEHLRGQGEVLYELGCVFRSVNEPEKASEMLGNSLVCHRKTGNRSGEVLVSVELAHLCADQSRIDEALALLYPALTIAHETGEKPLQCRIYRSLADVYEQQGDIPAAFKHYKLYHALERELFNEQSDGRMQNLRVLYEAEQARREAEIYRLKNIELGAANAELQRLDNEKNELLGIVAHNLRNPLSGIVLAASLVQQRSDKMDVEEISRQMAFVADAAGRMNIIIANLLDLNRIESGVFVPQPIPFNMTDLVQSFVKNYASHAERKFITIQYENEGQFSVLADLNATADIIDNLLSNAVKYAPSHTRITVRITGNEQMVRCEVQDEGPGILLEDMPRLFGKFARLSSQPTGGEDSVGLGLSIVKKLVEAMDGTVWCESTPGLGALFIVELPACSEDDFSLPD